MVDGVRVRSFVLIEKRWLHGHLSEESFKSSALLNVTSCVFVCFMLSA